jgi:replicative DNA helicase
MTDRTPPQDLDAEMATLGGMLGYQRAIAEVSEILIPADFYKPANELIYAAMLDLDTAGQPVDSLTVVAELDRRNELTRAGGAPYVHQLGAFITTAASVLWHAQIVRDVATRRRIIDVGTRIAQMGYETDDASDLAEIVDRAQAEANAISERAAREDDPTVRDAADEIVDELKNGVGTGLQTGFRDLDRLTHGLQPGQMIIVAARPGMGKSTLGLDIVRHVSIKRGLPSVFFSLEMNRKELVRRAISAEGSIPLHHMAPNCMNQDDWRRLEQVYERVVRAPITVNDRHDLTVMRMRSEARRLKQTTGLELAVVDYAQLAQSGSSRRHENRQTEVTEISRLLKLLGKELGIPVVVLAQLNRGPTQRADKRPVMSDLRESGSLEQDADVVLLLHREDEYETESPRAGEADFIVDKHRNGPKATITVAFQGHYSRFVDMAQA